VSLGYKEVLEQAPGLTPRMLDHWTRKGWLKADNAACGSGHTRTWPDKEVAVAALMFRLTTAGWFAEMAHSVARAVVEGWSERNHVTIGPGLCLVVEDPT
jgi:hypothetical protein